MVEVILFSLLGGVISLLGGLLLLARRGSAETIARYTMPFAAGALLAAAFFDLLRDGVEDNPDWALYGAAAGIAIFFILERFLTWFHHHHAHEDRRDDPKNTLIIAGDTIHNFIDGIAIAAAFLVDTPTGIVTTFAVALHEIPQEIGDFGILLSRGMARRKVLLFNILSALATTVSAVIFYSLGEADRLPIALLLGVTAGFFIYIAASDIIPTIHQKHPRGQLFDSSVALFIGALLLVGLASGAAHRYIHHEETAGHDHALDSHSETHVD